MDDPDRGWAWFAYDAAGSLVRTRDARGLEVAYAYDGVNRLRARWDCSAHETTGGGLGQGVLHLVVVGDRRDDLPAGLAAAQGVGAVVFYEHAISNRRVAMKLPAVEQRGQLGRGRGRSRRDHPC